MPINDINEDVAVVVPAFNEGTQIESTLVELLNYFKNIIVVDDGSLDSTPDKILVSGLIPVMHPVNLGQGAAIQTGIKAALINPKINLILTFDADGQHSIESAFTLISAIKNSNYDIILGSRYCDGAERINMPIKKKLLMFWAIAFTRFDSGLKVSDSHNGLRIMTRKFAESMNIKQHGMAHASEILNHVNNSKAVWKEVPVKIYYTKYSKKKGQSILNAVNIITELIHR